MEPSRGRARAQALPLNTAVPTVLVPPQVPRLATQTLVQVCISLLSFEFGFSANEQKHECQRIDYYLGDYLIDQILLFYTKSAIFQPYNCSFLYISSVFCLYITSVFRLYISSEFRLYITSVFSLYITSVFRLYISSVFRLYIKSAFRQYITIAFNNLYITSVFRLYITSVFRLYVTSVFRMEDNREGIGYFL